MAIVLVNPGGNTPKGEGFRPQEDGFEFTDSKPTESVLGGPDTRSVQNFGDPVTLGPVDLNAATAVYGDTDFRPMESLYPTLIPLSDDGLLTI